MLVFRLLPSIFWCCLPVLLQSFFVSIIYSFNLLWIIHEHTNSLEIITGTSFGQSLFIVFSVSLLTSTTKPLYQLTSIALSNGDFRRVGIFLQRSFLITHFIFIIIAILFYWSDTILSFILISIHANLINTHSIINITSNTLKILLFGAYALSIYYNIETFLFSQNLVRYSLFIIAGFGIFVEYFALNMFDNNNIDKYTSDVAALSITLCVQCLIMATLLMLYCCGCYQSYIGDEQSKYLLEKKKDNKGNTFNESATPSIPQKPWFHLSVWNGWDIAAMFNFYGIKQIVKYGIIQIGLHEFIIYFILIFVSSTISIQSFLAQVLTYNIMNILMVIPYSLSYALDSLIKKELSKGSDGISSLWDTVICLWLFVISILISIIYLCIDKIIVLYLPQMIDDELYQMIYDEFVNVSIPWMCLFIILYGLINVNDAVLSCIDLNFTVYSLLNSLVLLMVGIPLCFWLISSNHNIPSLLSSLNGVWFSLCLCCIVLLLYPLSKRCNIKWKYESKQYLKRKRNEKRKYRYEIELQNRNRCCCKRNKIYDANVLRNNEEQKEINLNIIANDSQIKIKSESIHKIYKKQRKRRHLKQLRSWSSMEANPYYQSSDFDNDKDTTNTNDDTLILKTDSEQESDDEDDEYDEYDTLEQYGDVLDTLDDDDEESSSVVIDNNNITQTRDIIDSSSIDSRTNDDDDTITTMDSREDQQMLNDLQSDSSSNRNQQIDA